MVLDTEPSEDVTITVVGAPTAAEDADADITVEHHLAHLRRRPSNPGDADGNWNESAAGDGDRARRR